MLPSIFFICQVLSKSAISQTMVVKWDDIARVTATEDINSTSQKGSNCIVCVHMCVCVCDIYSNTV